MTILKLPVILFLTFVAMLFTLAVILMVPRKADTPNAGDAKFNEIQKAFDLLPVYPGAREVNNYWYSKAVSASVGKYYKSDTDSGQIRAYYLERLDDLNWRFIEETKIRDWWRDLGGRQITFQQKDFMLTIQFAGEKADSGWDYAISINWSYNR